MTESHRFPRLRIQESDFPFTFPADFIETFLEVVDANGIVVALFCMVDSIEKREFTTLDEFSQYYDELFFQHRVDDCWAPKTNINGCVYPHCVNQNTIIQKALDVTSLINGFSAYGRLRFVFGSDNKGFRKMWEGFLNAVFLEDLLRYVLSEQYEKYRIDFLEIFRFLFDFWGVSGTHNRFRSIFSRFLDDKRLFVIPINAFVQLDLTIIEPMAGVLFAEDNIDLFIQKAARAKNKSLEDYLQEFKRKYLGYELNGYPRFRFLEGDFPDRFPPGTNSSLVIIDHEGIVVREPNPFYIDTPFFLEFINDAGETIALFHINENFHSICWWWHKPYLNLPWFPDKLAFTRYFDELSAVQYDKQVESYYDILIDVNQIHHEDYLQKMREHEVSSKQEYCLLAEISDVGGDIQADITNDSLIDYGRLMYPYLLDEATKSKYESKLKEDLEELWCAINNYTEDEWDNEVEEWVDILRFFFNHSKKEGISCTEVIKDMLLDIIHCFDNKDIFFYIDNIFYDQIAAEIIAPLIEAARETDNTELITFLLDYQNKHFPPEGTAALKLDS
jgi:hypothetical protein